MQTNENKNKVTEFFKTHNIEEIGHDTTAQYGQLIRKMVTK